MAKIVMPKNSALLNEIEAVLQIYYEAGGWIANETYKAKLKRMIGDDQYSSSYTKKAQITSYFGFTEWQDIGNPQSLRRITDSGKAMYEALIAKDTGKVQEILMGSLETTKFGRNNFGCPDSNSDVEPPALFIRASLDLGYLTYKEFAYLLWKLEDIGANYTDSIPEIRRFRASGQVDLGEEANKYVDCKPIMILVRWGFLQEVEGDTTGGKHIVVAPAVLRRFESRLRNLKIYNVDMDCDKPIRDEERDAEDKDGLGTVKRVSVGGGENIIFYGVPGCGKSYKIKSEYCNDDEYMERVVFHPDFTYSDFVGQILPTTDGEKISYPFVPGPFTRILKAAVADPSHRYYLVVEEINRGNAPAIFGEVFQLLDRENGESEYGITNSDIAAQVYFDESGTALPNHKVKIPANLFILATMNTADQNVFTLDTAFKRRWKMVSVKNEIANCDHANNPICGTNVTWASFATAINSKIIEVGEGNLSSEDNRLGAYFVKADDLTDVDVFSEKVLMYLWNDAFKFDREKVFKPEYKTLDQLIDGFKNNLFDVFSGEFSFDSSSPSISGDDVGNTEAITVSAFLNDKTQSQVDLYSALKEYISGIVSAVSDGATRNYIALKQNGTNIAEIHFLKNEVQINTKQPQQGELRIGTLLPDTYRWSNNYRITLTSDNLQIVGDAIIDAYGLLG